MIKESFQKGKTGLGTPKPTGGKKCQEKQNLVCTDPEHTGSGHGPSAKVMPQEKGEAGNVFLKNRKVPDENPLSWELSRREFLVRRLRKQKPKEGTLARCITWNQSVETE